jgi:polysaccharide export outer membrane protein
VVESGRTEQFSVDARDSLGWKFKLLEFDHVEVLDGRVLFPSGSVSVSGGVNRPSRRPFVERQSLRDLIDVSGGFREDAQFVEISRRRSGVAYSDTTAIILRVPITATSFARDGEASRFILERGDAVTVRVSPGFRQMPTVTLSGLFEYPGAYALQHDNETLREVVLRAHLLPSAAPLTFRLLRGGRVVPVNLSRALRGEHGDNIALADNDQLIVDADPQTVTVAGAVERPVSVPYRNGWRLSDYVAAAGGRKTNASRSVLIEDATGAVSRATSHFRIFKDNPAVTSGSKLLVLTEETSTNSNGETLTRVLQVATTAMSVILAYLAATRP